MNVFDRLEDEIICHANDDNYKESYALFKIGDVEELIDSYRCLQFKIGKAIRILNADTNVENCYKGFYNLLINDEFNYEIDNDEINKILKGE